MMLMTINDDDDFDIISKVKFYLTFTRGNAHIVGTCIICLAELTDDTQHAAALRLLI